MRRKPSFDRFMSGLSQRITGMVNDQDWETQDLINITRSECSKIWKHLIEKINTLEKEIESKDSIIKELEDAVKYYAGESSWDNADELFHTIAINEKDHEKTDPEKCVCMDNKWQFCNCVLTGGKLARATLKKVEEMRKKQESKE